LATLAAKTQDNRFIGEAFAVCRAGIDAGQAPFGAVLVECGQIVARQHNTGRRDHDPTAHAEVNAIRAACREVQRTDLAGMTLYSTCEPCPMCFAAAGFAGINRVVWAASVDDARAAGFTTLQVPNRVMIDATGHRIESVGGVRRAEAIELFERWRALKVQPPAPAGSSPPGRR
jgi:tRNA(Arg) A34 adenosine deaminase TadA